MKRLFSVLLLILITQWVVAIPVKKSGWKVIRLASGVEVRAMFKGDEHLHYMEAEDGQKYVFDEQLQAYRPADFTTLARKAVAKRRRLAACRYEKTRGSLGEKHAGYEGNKKGLMILVDFEDTKFSETHTKELYQQITNKLGFVHQLGFRGSVRDYFLDQSRGKFDLTFDVVGPIRMKRNYAYYGANDREGYDIRPQEMIQEACEGADAEVDFRDYDWDHDGKVDALYVLYAGQGENSTEGQDSKRVWPHQAELSESNFDFNLDQVTIDSYACGPELSSRTQIEGIGTICHEFSHVLGLPDMYDTLHGEAYGMFSWDVMDQGSYNVGGFVPAGYTSYERTYLGWLNPIELTSDLIVTKMKPLSEQGEAYVIYNENNRNEYYLLENRRKTGWDAGLGGEGLLILHVDFDAKTWADNTVNSQKNHQRCTIFHADNSDAYLDMWGNYSASEIAGDAYPYQANDSLAANSKPAARLFNANRWGTYFMNKDVNEITRNEDGTISFRFKVVAASTKPNQTPSDGILFHETFDQCKGTGGNDGKFSGQVARSMNNFMTDMEGWNVPSGAAYGGDRCAKFGTSSKNGTVLSPEFDAHGNDTLIFVAAPFGKDDNTLDVYINDSLLGVFTLDRGKWTTIKVPFIGTGATTIQFVPDNRFFLDDVKVIGPTNKQETGIKQLEAKPNTRQPFKIYNLNGQFVGTKLDALPKGIYISNGKKILKF